MKIRWTSEWQARCPRCNHARSMSSIGGRRTAPTSLTKHTLGWCSSCRSFRVLIVEAVEASPLRARAEAGRHPDRTRR